MSRREDRGYSLVEIVLAAAVGTVVLAAVAALIWFATVSLTRSNDRTGPRESAHMALATLFASLRDAWQYRIDPDGTHIHFQTPRMGGEAWLDPVQQKLLFKSPGRPRTDELIDRGVLSLKIESIRPGCLRFTLSLGRPEATGKMKSLPPFTIVDELFIPAIALRDPSVPWNRALEHQKAMEPSG